MYLLPASSATHARSHATPGQSAAYRHIQLLNRLRRAYLGPIVGCDAPLSIQDLSRNGSVTAGAPAVDVFAWERGCEGDGSALDQRLLLVLNLDKVGAAHNVTVRAAWPRELKLITIFP